MYRKQQGFTLVEIAIVLVIIGLLLGGVLKGQELITSAKIKNLGNDLNGLSAATYAYQDRFRALPGDDANASTRWTSITSLPSTVGNAKVDGVYTSTTQADESLLFFRELRLAGLISGDSTTGTQPANAVGGIMGVQTDAANRAVTAGAGHGLNGLVGCHTGVLGKIAEALDNQLDDGKPNAGAVKSWTQTGSTPVDLTPADSSGTAPATGYVDDGSTMYTVCKRLL